MRISSTVLARLELEARNAAPMECCGVLWSRGDQAIHAFLAYPGRLFPDRFCFDDQWWLRTLYEARAKALRVAGIYHSHPGGCALIPSCRDQRGHPGVSSLLLSGDGGTPRVFALGVGQESMCELPLRIVGSSYDGIV
jgi:desampylase